MPKICYQDMKFGPDRLGLIDRANKIISEYTAQGFDLTLRQLYYQFVARAIIPNNERSYKNLGNLVNDARLAGLIDWNHIQDRTRNVRVNAHWDSPGDIVEACAKQFQFDKWEGQPYRVEVWIEKDALVGVIEGVCKRLDLPFFSCRGYTSQSEMWAAAQRLIKYQGRDNYGLDDPHSLDDYTQTPVILHFGDHDPSGIDMSRDIEDRLKMFVQGRFVFERLALNMNQVRQYNPPPNPAKLPDSRANGYVALHGDESWELDALEPRVIADLITRAVLRYRDEDLWAAAVDRERDARDALQKASDHWESVTDFLNEGGQ